MKSLVIIRTFRLLQKSRANISKFWVFKKEKGDTPSDFLLHKLLGINYFLGEMGTAPILFGMIWHDSCL